MILSFSRGLTRLAGALWLSPQLFHLPSHVLTLEARSLTRIVWLARPALLCVRFILQPRVLLVYKSPPATLSATQPLSPKVRYRLASKGFPLSTDIVPWGTPDLTHTQLPSRTACRRCLTLPEPRVLASALCSAAVGTVQCDSKPGTMHAASQKLAPSVSLHLDGPRPHARLPFSLRWLPAVPAKLLLRSLAHWHPSCRPDAGYSQHPPEAALGWRPQMVSALNRTWLRKLA